MLALARSVADPVSRVELCAGCGRRRDVVDAIDELFRKQTDDIAAIPVSFLEKLED